ncbi:hypothetical protein PHYSODRAFT_554653 [Phytophthora sojae]|uniref:Uncharacterized protein n=1 Tax=Phytophthora sojae (strain P6497) TaxID=1094619 RepID=G4YXK8_PHYSP|nr:hypothetical protein PHYSODRAFT_554653 [Phytophthora sojae]EGZ24497.1 hypothetical protein PHYSODRAFT_554653 [Phytophthora sojae]|eukprot:XP_009519785.1 hypothetical protein PHYSODRAFT_554653 [Phytophthora sojae]
MGLSEFFRDLWDLVRSPFEDCTSCCDVLDPDYYRKTSPGVRRTPQMFNRWDHDVKFDVGSNPPSRLPPSFSFSPVISSSHAGRTQRSFTSPASLSGSSPSSGSGSASRSQSPSSYSYEEEDERQVQFLFYGGSDPPTPTGGGAYPSGYRSDMISKYIQPTEPISPASIASPRISHEMPCFFSPRTTPTSPMSAPIYSPHLFKITEQRTRNAEYYRRYTSR